MKKLKKRKGFTLVEMVITMVIVITLSLLSFPLYRGRNHEQSKLAEGYALLGVIIDAQVAYYNEYGNFLSVFETPEQKSFTANDVVLGINAVNNRYFTNFVINDNDQRTWGQNDLRKLSGYYCKAKVISKSAGTISLEYNLTQRFEPIVIGV